MLITKNPPFNKKLTKHFPKLGGCWEVVVVVVVAAAVVVGMAGAEVMMLKVKAVAE